MPFSGSDMFSQPSPSRSNVFVCLIDADKEQYDGVNEKMIGGMSRDELARRLFELLDEVRPAFAPLHCRRAMPIMCWTLALHVSYSCSRCAGSPSPPHAPSRTQGPGGAVKQFLDLHVIIKQLVYDLSTSASEAEKLRLSIVKPGRKP